MRLFIGIATPADDEILALLHELMRAEQSYVGLQAMDSANLHVTLKFLGEVDAEQVPAIVAAMAAVLAQEQSFDLQLGAAGAFPSALWLEASAPPLQRLAKRLDEALVGLGCEPERRAYQPHVTLARLQPIALFDVLGWLERHEQRQPLVLPIDSVHLYQSVSMADGVSYKPLHTLRLPVSSTAS